MPHPKEGKVFFILAILVMLIGHQFLQGDDLLTGAGATKTTTTKTATPSKTTTDKTATDTTTSKTMTDTTSTDTAKTTETEPVEKTTTSDTAVKTETTTTEKTTAPTTTEKTPLAGKAIYNVETKETNQTAFTKTTTTEKEVVIKEFIPTSTEEKDQLKTESSTTFTTTKIVLENTGTTPLTLIPTIKTTPFSLPNEENLNRLIREKIQAGEGLISAPELAQKTEKKIAGIKAVEKAKVKPLYVRKIYRPFETITGQSVSDITYTGQATAGELLLPRLLDASIVMLPPQEQATIDLAIREPLAIEEQVVDISFSSQGQEVVSSKFQFPKSKTGTAIDMHPEQQLLDLYVIINPADMEKKGENYYVELVLTKGNKVLYFELLGPYTVKSPEPVLFSQEFKYPSQYAGEYVLTATIDQNTQRIITQEHLVEFVPELK